MLTLTTIDRMAQELQLRGIAAKTILAYSSDMRLALAWLETTGIATTGNMNGVLPLEVAFAQYLNAHRDEWEPRTTKRRLAAARCWARINLDNDRFLKDYRPPKPEKQEPHPLPRGRYDIELLLNATKTTQKRALIALCAQCGLRVSEACAVKPEHIDVRQMILTVRGKGDKVRKIPLSRRAWSNIQGAYVDAVVLGSGTLVRVKERGARASISALGRRAGLTRHIKSHDLRATCATIMLEETKDLSAVQEVLGHESSDTTRIYTSISDARKRAALETV